MSRKQVLIVGASGLVGYAAMRHFGADPDCDVIALSRRAPDHTHGARFLPLDLTDAAACEQLAVSLPGVTHLVLRRSVRTPRLVAGWREREQIETNERMFRKRVRSAGTAREESAPRDAAAGHQGPMVSMFRPLAVPGGKIVRKCTSNLTSTGIRKTTCVPCNGARTGPGQSCVRC